MYQSSSSHRWSEWTWHEEYRKYYRYRVDSRGEPHYEWDQRETTTTAREGRSDETPREPDSAAIRRGVDAITDGVANLETGGYSEHDEREYEVSGRTREKSSRKSKKSSKSSKGKHRAYSDEDEEYQSHGHAARSSAEDYDPEQYPYSSSAGQYDARPSMTDPQRGPDAYPVPIAYSTSGTSHQAPAARSAAHSSSRDAYDHAYDDENAELLAAVADSQAYNYGAQARPGESSGAAAAVRSVYDSLQSAEIADSSVYGPYDEDLDDDGPPTPRNLYNISATDEILEEIDPRYRVEHSNRFAPGEIFKVHWSEPQGSGGTHAPSISGRQEVKNRFGTKFFVGFRRFIVVANDQGHCTCVPILTYGGKGCKKSGVKPDKHGIICQRGHKPKLLDREPKLGFAPVRVEMTEEGEKLSKESRVNYSKLITVEHNVNVFFIGSITPGDWDTVSEAVNLCWNQKVHHKKKFR